MGLVLKQRPSVLDALSDGEFPVFVDPNVHFIEQNGIQQQIHPSTLVITNKHVFVDPRFESPGIQTLDINRISTANVIQANEFSVVQIGGKTQILIFVPDDSDRAGLFELFKRIVAERKISKRSLQYFLSQLRIAVRDYPSMHDFYVAGLPEMEDTGSKEAMLSTILLPFDVIAEGLTFDSKLVFALALPFAPLLSLFFRYISFGMFLSGVGLIVIIRIGITKALTKAKKREPINFSKEKRSLQSFYASLNGVVESFFQRFLWEDKAKTLEILWFMLILFMMFMVMKPGFLLYTSIFLVVFFERWNPIGIGSIPALLSKLVLW